MYILLGHVDYYYQFIVTYYLLTEYKFMYSIKQLAVNYVCHYENKTKQFAKSYTQCYFINYYFPQFVIKWLMVCVIIFIFTFCTFI